MTSGRYTPPPPVRELTARSDDGTALNVQLHGPEDAPAVLLVHGWTCSTAFWAAQIRDLAADHRVIAYDLRGHGRSQAPRGPNGYGTRQLADDLEAVLRAALEPDRRAVLAGHSMGGMTLMAAARSDALREHAAAVLLCSTGSSRLVDGSLVLPMRAGRLRTRLTGLLLNSRAPLGPVTPVSKRILKYATMGRAATPEMVEVCARIVQACPRESRHHWSQVLGRLDLDVEVPRLSVPTAILVGTADRFTPPAQARALAAALPHCVDVTELPGLGHMVPVEAPDEVNRRIRELVATHLTAKGAASA
ncbi:hydrolase [Streptomyces sulfonofaciens]|uniref:Hydrolase n=1 Tax=Streptomyces sulfonofaciens TaxID=68272 RepID=A0A919L139_9ACTN|nr:alpha/beta hydrolase [Streptomyces sulfonofaciens]GHH80127.1 hydrolase [Streptomyces sulfonofaciens]